MENAQSKVISDNIQDTIPMSKKSGTIKVDDQQSKKETPNQNSVSHMEEPEVQNYLNSIVATINKLEAKQILQQEEQILQQETSSKNKQIQNNKRLKKKESKPTAENKKKSE